MRYSNHFVFFLLSFFLTFTFARAEEIHDLEGLEAKIDAFVEKARPHPDSGLAVGLVKDGKLVFFKAYGLRDREKKQPITEDTLFAIGSCTKSFTSLGVAMLADEGKLALDSPVRSVLPDFTLSDISLSERASFVDLLTHRVGLPRHDMVWYATPFSSDELFERLPYLALNRKPGKGFREAHQYNNLMYMVLGRAIAKASGKSWERFTEERIFNKLGMTSAQFSVEENERGEAFALPYRAEKALAYKNLQSVGPAGSINANMRDGVRWISFWQRGGVSESGERLVSEESLHRIFRPESHVDAPSWGVQFDYGLGWFLNEVAGKKIAWHAGNIDGFSAHMSFAPGENLGLVVLTNENGAIQFQLPWKTAQGGTEKKLLPYVIYEHLFEKSSVGGDGAQLHKPPLAFVRQPFASPAPSPFHAFVAFLAPLVREQEFHDLGYGRLVLRSEGGQYTIQYYNQVSLLVPTGEPDVFLAASPENPDEKVEVRLLRAGEEILSVSVPFEPEVDPIVFLRTK